jgi:hypothetical protein
MKDEELEMIYEIERSCDVSDLWQDYAPKIIHHLSERQDTSLAKKT